MENHEEVAAKLVAEALERAATGKMHMRITLELVASEGYRQRVLGNLDRMLTSLYSSGNLRPEAVRMDHQQMADDVAAMCIVGAMFELADKGMKTAMARHHFMLRKPMPHEVVAAHTPNGDFKLTVKREDLA